MSDSHIVLYKGGQGEVVEKKSRFIAQLFPIKEEEEALEKIAEIKKKHYDARHNCFAYVLGENYETERCSDDGEPSGTAGRPMLDILTGAGIHNAVAVVTRYFGGTLLGTGGLVRAYSAAMKEALENCVLMEQLSGYRLRIQTDYNEVGKLQYLAKMMELIEVESVYGIEVEMTLLVPEQRIDEVEKAITEKTGGKAKLERIAKENYGLAGGEVVFL